MRIVLVAAAALLCVACGGERRIKVKTRSVKAAPVMGPKASPEEIDGEVPPLRSVIPEVILVPPKLVPPEAPADPSFGPDGDAPADDEDPGA